MRGLVNRYKVRRNRDWCILVQNRVTMAKNPSVGVFKYLEEMILNISTRKKLQGLGCGSMVEILLHMCEDMDLTS